MTEPLPRVVLAAPASGQGKTTVAVGLMAALSRAGHEVAGVKVGPDYIDPGYHALATGRPGRNLDPWLHGEERLIPLLRHAFQAPRTADVAVVEGVTGMYDGRLGTDGYGSTAHVAALTSSPVLLVVDVSGAARTVASTVLGLRDYDPAVHVAGVVLNRVGSPRHEAEVRRAVEGLGVQVVGALPRDEGVSVPSRHLGLVPAAERVQSGGALDRLAEHVATRVDLAAVLEIARGAAPLASESWAPPSPVVDGEPVVAVAGGRAFTFRYPENEEVLAGLGCRVEVFDPLVDTELPAGTRAIYLGGGFPEVHSAALGRNTALLGQLRDAVLAGVPTVAECAGLLYLTESVDDRPMAGVLPLRAATGPRLHLGYRTGRAAESTLLADAGHEVRGHEFHRTAVQPTEESVTPAWLLEAGPDGISLDPADTGSPTVHASYLHLSYAGHPELAERLARAAARSTWTPAAPTAIRPVATVVADAPPSDPLRHHGDVETGTGLVDLAVNVRGSRPPEWLADVLRQAVDDLAAYPDTAPAVDAIAAHHRVPTDCVLPTSGAAEAFSLVAAALPTRLAAVVHPGFTEPESALRRAGRRVTQVVLDPRAPFDPALVPEDADLVVIGNPTNPTGRVHPAADLLALRRPGRVVLVDEAFIDQVPAERESLVGGDLTGLLVTRSLTKTWSLAGLRAGYVVGDLELVALLADHQSPWAVSTLAIRAMVACTSPRALAEARAAADETARCREHLATGLRALGLDPLPSEAPYVLVEAGAGVREELRGRGYAVRRGDTFPGLGPEWVRIAVRDPLTTDGLLRELRAVLTSRQEATA